MVRMLPKRGKCNGTGKGSVWRGKNGILEEFRYTAFRTNQQQDCIDFSTEWPPPKGIDCRYNFWGHTHLVKSIMHSSRASIVF